MIFRRLIAVKDFRIFNAWKDAEQQRPHRFGKQTVIYGPNGSGKSTLAEIFRTIQISQSSGKSGDERLPGIQFELADATGAQKQLADDQAIPPLLVFNDHYVAENLSKAFESGDHGAALYVLGVKDIDLEKNIATQESNHQLAIDALPALKVSQKTADDELSKVIERAKRDVSDALSLYKPELYNPTKYNRQKVATLLSGPKQLLTPEELEVATKDLTLSIDAIPADLALTVPPATQELSSTIADISTFDVKARTIARLAGDQPLSDWAQAGLALHHNGDTCAFCESLIRDERLAELRAHFDASFIELQSAIATAVARVDHFESLLAHAKGAIDAIGEVNGSFREFVLGSVDAIQAFWAQGATWVRSAREILRTRAENPFSHASWEAPPDPDMTIWAQLQAAADQENTKLAVRRAGIAKINEKACSSILQHIAEKHHTDHDAAIASTTSARENLESAERDVRALVALLNDLRGKRRDSNDGDKLALELTADLCNYLGHRQLMVKFERQPTRAGILILRNGAPATNLSEGERNAIALLYFLRSFDAIGVNDKINGSCVVIDDPVSSLDQDAILSAFTFLLNRLRDPGGELACAQLILLTHNLDFFRLWKDRLRGGIDKDQKKATSEKKLISDLQTRRATLLEFSIRTSLSGSEVIRRPILREIGVGLDAQRSEYFFLFERACKSTHLDGEELLGLTGNATRRLLESFVSFKSPNRSDLTSGADALGELHNVPSITRSRVVKALHATSHRTELDIHSQEHSSSIVEDIRSALMFIRAVDADHYEGMCAATNARPYFPAEESPPL